MDFTGVKAALLYDGQLLVYKRDNKPGLRFAGMWDFFGGGREGNESLFECISRELEEELEIHIQESQVIFQKIFPAMHDSSINAYFVVIMLTNNNIQELHFGSEGQEYKLTTIKEFFNDESYVPLLKPRLQSYLEFAGQGISTHA